MLKKLAPFWKAIAPAVLGAVASVANALAAGTFNTASIEAVIGGVVAAIVVYFAPANKPANAPVKLNPLPHGKPPAK